MYSYIYAPSISRIRMFMFTYIYAVYAIHVHVYKSNLMFHLFAIPAIFDLTLTKTDLRRREAPFVILFGGTLFISVSVIWLN
jgi:hypothetical protein